MFETTEFKNIKFKKIILINHKNNYRKINLSKKVIKFKSSLLEDQKRRLEEKSINCEIASIDEIKISLKIFMLFILLLEKI